MVPSANGDVAKPQCKSSGVLVLIPLTNDIDCIIQDDLISPYIARLLPNIQQTLTSARQRLILPGMPAQFQDTSRQISEIQEILNRKPLPSH